MGRAVHVRENAGILGVEPLSPETIESLFRSVG
jgi:hypothetical protein